MKNYLDPAQNPFIQLGDADGNPRPKDDGETLSEDVEGRIPLPDKDGLFPGEKKVGAAESSSSLETAEKIALEGINDASLRELMGADETLYIYDRAFYAAETPDEKKFFMKPVIELVKRGPEVIVNRLDGGANILTKHETDLIREAMKRKAG